MSSIRSRKHPAGRYLTALSIMGVAALAAQTLPAVAHADAAADAPDGKGTTVTINGHRDAYKTDNSDSLKATAPLLDTPQTIDVITDQLMREQGATNLTEALRASPGIGTFYLGENGTTSTGDAVFLRGSDVSNSIFVDGVRDVASVSRDIFNIEQVEVLKGAAGTDVGRGSATGAVSLSTKHAKPASFTVGSAGVGGGDYSRFTIDSNQRIGKSAALRVNVLAQNAGVNGRDLVRNKRWGLATSLGFGLNDKTRYFFDLMHVSQNNIPDGGVSTVGLPGYTTPNPGTRDFLTTAARPSPSNFYGTKDDHDNIETNVVTFTVTHDFSDSLRLNNITRWSQTDQEYQLMSMMAASATLLTPNVNDPSTWTISRSVNNKNATNTMLTNQTNLQAHFSTGSLAHSVSTGLELIDEEQLSRTYVGTGAYPAANLYHPNPNVSGYTRALSGAYTDGETKTVAVYFNDTVKFSPSWQMTGGVRVDHYKTTYDSVTATGVVTPLSAEDDLFSGKLGLVYKPQEDGSLYVSYAVTQQPPGGSNFSLSATNTTNANNPDVEPQSAKTIEAGTKWNLMHDHLSVTGAVYSTKYSDTIAQDTDGTYYRTGEKSISGIELGVGGQITRDWGITAGYTIMDSKVTNAPLVAADGTPNLTYNPSDSGSLWTTYDFHHKFTIGGGLRYNGEMHRGTDGAVGTPKLVKSYVVMDGVATWHFNRKVDLQFNVYNLFDKVYVAAINKSGYRYTPGQPRTFKVAVNARF